MFHAICFVVGRQLVEHRSYGARRDIRRDADVSLPSKKRTYVRTRIFANQNARFTSNGGYLFLVGEYRIVPLPHPLTRTKTLTAKAKNYGRFFFFPIYEVSFNNYLFSISKSFPAVSRHAYEFNFHNLRLGRRQRVRKPWTTIPRPCLPPSKMENPYKFCQLLISPRYKTFVRIYLLLPLVIFFLVNFSTTNLHNTRIHTDDSVRNRKTKKKKNEKNFLRRTRSLKVESERKLLRSWSTNSREAFRQ